MNLDDLALFATVVEAGSLSAAARRLRLSKAAVSDRLRRLEERLGARLLDRSTRRLSPTEAGRAAYDHARRMVEAGEAAARAAGSLHEEARGLLRIAAPTTFAPLHLAPLLPEFLAAHPDLRIELVLAPGASDLLAEGLDLAVRIGPLADSRLTARRLGRSRVLLTASPAYLARRGRPEAPTALPAHDLLAFTPLGRQGEWALKGPGRTTAAVAFQPRLACDDGETLLQAALAGLGIAALPDWMVAAPLAERRLETVLPGWGADPVPIHALHAGGRQPAAKIRRFVDCLAERLPRDGWIA